MGSFSPARWLVVLAVALVIFGAGRLPKAMGKLARGMRAFRTGMRDDAASEAAGQRPLEAQPAERSLP